MIIAIGNIIGKSGGFRTDGNVPVNTIAPVISGTALVGNTLTSTTGTWTSDTGVTGYLYQWTRNGVNISGATNITYTLVNADLNTNIICKVAATDTDGTSAYVNSNSLVIYEVEYKAVLDYGNSLGYTLPSVSQRLKQSILLSSLKTAGVWSKLDTFANFATDGSSNFALIDWKRLSLYTAVNSPTFTTNQGFRGNGLSSYVDTNFKPSVNAVNMSVNSSSFNIYQRIDQTSIGNGHGAYLTPSGLYINPLVATGFRSWNNSNMGVNGGIYSGAPSFCSTDRSASGSIQHINNGIQIGSITLSSTSLPTRNILLFASANNSTTGISEFNNAQISLVSIGSSLNSEKTAYYNAVNSYINSL